MVTPKLKINSTPGANVTPIGEGVWHLEIPAGPQGQYRLAQLDDYSGLPRRAFPWHFPLTMTLRARASAVDLPGTWGFGLWNDPFSLSLGIGGGGVASNSSRFPSLPNTSWFFYASPPNYLSFHDNLPAQGFLAATFHSPSIAVPWMVLASPFLALFTLPPAARMLRRIVRRIISQDAALVEAGLNLTNGSTAPKRRPAPTDWHAYRLDWGAEYVTFGVDGETIFTTSVSPRGPLGLVLWVDNQYVALPPNGRLAFGTLPNPVPAWIEIGDLRIAS
jgi:hypothetical protein